MDRSSSLITGIKCIAILLVLCMVGISCSTQKGIVKEKTGKDLLGSKPSKEESLLVQDKLLWQQLQEKNKLPDNFSANYNIHIEGELLSKMGIPGRLSGQIKLLKDSVIWLSAGVMGIEVFRFWINNDSAYVLNRMQKECKIYSLSNILDKYPLVECLSGLLTGTIPPIADKWDMKKNREGEENAIVEFKYEPEGKSDLSFFCRFDEDKLKGIVLKHKAQIVEFKYSDPWIWELLLSGSEKGTKIKAIYNKVKVNEGVSVQMLIPENYSVYVY